MVYLFAVDAIGLSLKPSDAEFTESVCLKNIENSINEILQNSPFIKEESVNGKPGVVSDYYDKGTGMVNFESLISNTKNQR